MPRGLRTYLFFILALVAAFALTAPWQIGGRDVGRFSVALLVALNLVAAALIVPAWRRALFGLFREREIRFSRRALLLAAALAGLFLCRVVAARWMSLDINASDTTLYADRPIAETLRGNLLYCDFEGHSHLGNHASWLLLAFVPLYWIAASPLWLLLAHPLAIAAAAAAGFLLFRRLLGDDLTAAFIAAAFLLNSYTAKAVQYAFHVEIFYPLAFLGVWETQLVMTVMFTNYLMKSGWEAVMTPVTYKIVGWLKRVENEDYYDRETDFNPFTLQTDGSNPNKTPDLPLGTVEESAND